MNKTKNKKRKTINNKAVQKEYNKDIIGVIIISLGIITLLSLFSTKMGLVGQIINGTTFSLLGFGGYFFPLFIIGTGCIFILDRFDKSGVKPYIATLVIFLSFLVVLDGINSSTSGLISRIQNGILLSTMNKGGGLVGSFLGYFFYKLFGSIGTYIVLSALITICLLILTNTKVKDVIKRTNVFKSGKVSTTSVKKLVQKS